MDDGVKVGSPAGPEAGASGAHAAETLSGGPLTFASSAVDSNSSLNAGGDGVPTAQSEQDEGTRVSAYARLDFESFTFYVQTLQVFLGRRAQNGQNMVDVHLGNAKAISRRHAKIFYNFATQRFEFTVMGRNGAFVGGVFVENGSTVPLSDNTRIQIGQINFKFVLPSLPKDEANNADPDATETLSGAADTGADTDSNEDETNFFAVQKKHRPKQQQQQQTSHKEPAAPKPKKREYLPEEIPLDAREKPGISYSSLITTALRERAGEHGLSLADIYEAIMELFPYYRYCPSGWQNSVRHNLSSSKAFRKVSKEGKGWLWGLDQEYFDEKDKKKAASKQRRASNDKSIAELAQEIPARRPSESARPRTESGNLLSPALIRLLARLQNQLQGHLAKAGGKSINPNILSNALANVVARAAKASGGIDQLEKLLQSPQQVNLILVQALEFVKYQRRRASDASEAAATPGPNTPGPQTPGATTPGPSAPTSVNASVIGQAIKQEVGAPPPMPSVPSIDTIHSTDPATQIPQSETVKDEPETSQQQAAEQHHAQIEQATVQPHVQDMASTRAENPQDLAIPGRDSTQAATEVPVTAQAGQSATQAPAQAPVTAAAAQAPGAAAPAKHKYTPEQIAQLIAQAEKVPNPSPSILAAIEQLRVHQRAMLKRPADPGAPEPPIKRPTTTNEA